MDIPAALTGISTALTIVKQLNDIDSRVDEAAFKLKIAEATIALAEAKMGLVDAQETLKEKDRELIRLQGHLKNRNENLIEFRGYRYEARDGKPIGEPVCPICEESGSHIKLVRSIGVQGQPMVCPKCKSNHGYVSTFAYPD